MKLNTREFLLKFVCGRVWTALMVVFLFVNIDAIRVYEGTNFPAPPSKIQKSIGLTKKLSFISKRSWSPIDDGIKSSQKADRRMEGKWKDYNRRTMTDGSPSLYKIKFTDKNYMQYLRYIREIPRLEEYTFCLWYKPTNLTHDQTLFSYSLNKNEVLLRFWINSIDSTLRLAIRENVVYKVPANIREYKWHHICQSWNGVLAEVQIFFDGRKIGEGVLPHYKGTYIPEGGEVTLGQDISGLGKRFNDGMDGEMFGFNMVDESVTREQANFINSQYRPNVHASVPPFKKLPPIKKTYQEIKAYISNLPSDPIDSRRKNEAIQSEEPSLVKKPKDSHSVPSKRNRGNHRIRYPPLRKVVVYNRDDRQLPLNEALVELNKTNPSQVKSAVPPKNSTMGVYDENYSIHSYRFGKQEKKVPNYEIYEVLEDDSVLQPADEQTDDKSLEKKAKQNFNLFTAREANKVYTLSNSVKDWKKPKFHFETKAEGLAQIRTNQRSFKDDEVVAEIVAPADKTDSIPVYEIVETESRKKRSADENRKAKQFDLGDPLVDVNGFRRLPQIPESFISLFTQNASKSEIQEKLEEFFPEAESKAANIVAETTEPPNFIPVTDIIALKTTVVGKMFEQFPEESEAVMNVTETPEPVVVPDFSPMPASIIAVENTPQAQATDVLSNPKPINFPVILEIQEIRQPLEETSFKNRYSFSEETPLQATERKFEISAGTDLVVRSYGECTSERGSPVQEKHHLVISWADTPVRIFGGAQVESARNECGNF